MRIKDSFDACKVEVGTYWPPIQFNLICRDCKIGDKAYKYRSHGGWFMIILGLLPVIWTTCPFTWQIGLAIGTVLALMLNTITYFLFDKKIKRLVDNISNPKSKENSSENALPDVEIHIDKPYFYALHNTAFVIANHDGKKYIMISETPDQLQNKINSAGKQNEYIVHSKLIGAIMHNIKNYDDVAGIALINGETTSITSIAELNKMNIPDYLETELESGSKIYAFKIREGSLSHVTYDEQIVISLNYKNAIHLINTLKLNDIQDVTIETIKPSRLIDLIQNSPGILILGANGLIDYNKSSEEVVQILRKFC